MSAPLTGTRVLEMANFISGPFAGLLLADLGAEVIKIESVGTGDPFRKWGGHKGGARPQFAAYNRGKQSVTLDIRSEAGQEAYRRLAATCDIVIENFRPGALDRANVGYDALKAVNPRLVYCSITGMGETGPYAGRPSYENVGLALSGLWSRLVDMADPRPIGPNLVDQLTSMFAVYGILGALVHARATGIGQRVDVNMLASTLAFMPEPIANYLMLGEVGDRDTRARRSQAYALLASDGRPLAIHLSSVPKFWEGLTRAIERPELVEDPRFLTNADRVRHYDDLRAILVDIFATRDRDAWLERLVAEDVPTAPINTIAEALDDPQVRHLGLIRTFGTGEAAVRLIGSPVDFHDTADRNEQPPPGLGEQTDAVLSGLGYTTEEVAAFRRDGVV